MVAALLEPFPLVQVAALVVQPVLSELPMAELSFLAAAGLGLVVCELAYLDQVS